MNSHSRRFLFLLVFLLVYIFLDVLLVPSKHQPLHMLDIVFTGLLVSGAYAASGKKRSLIISLMLVIPAVALTWLSVLLNRPFLTVSTHVLVISFLGYIGGTILTHVMRTDRITLDTIGAALCVYLVLGLIWALIYSLIEYIHPGSFLRGGMSVAARGVGSVNPTFEARIYFSFTTLTTLGYGDITPQTPAAQSLCILEAILGQIYLAVTIARLVGLQVSQAARDRSL